MDMPHMMGTSVAIVMHDIWVIIIEIDLGNVFGDPFVYVVHHHPRRMIWGRTVAVGVI
jgi:hypothetical protein